MNAKRTSASPAAPGAPRPATGSPATKPGQTWSMRPGEVDPYALWSRLTDGRYLAHAVPGQMSMLACRKGCTVAALRAAIADDTGLRIPAVYPDGAMFCTLRADPLNPDDPDAAELRRQVSERLDRLALVIGADPAKAAAVPPAPAPPAGGATAAARAAPAEPGKGQHPAPRVVVAVIDGLCAFAHRRFCTTLDGRPHSRLLAYWDQGQAANAPWHTPSTMGWGRELDRADIDDLLARHLDPSAIDSGRQVAERELYRSAAHAWPEECDWSHGVHMLDTAGGGDGDPGDPISDVDLLYVQLPTPALYDTSARWMPHHVLDALRYVVDRAGPQARVIVNLSLGAFAGPHDGSSPLERAIDALIDEIGPRLTVVVAAGNARAPQDDGTGEVRPCHARARLAASGHSGDRATLPIALGMRDTAETFIELWLPASEALTGDQGLWVSLTPDDGLEQPGLQAGPDQVALRCDPGLVQAAVINMSGQTKAPALGDGRVVLVALGATEASHGAASGPQRWSLTLLNMGASPVIADAWIQRRDIPGELAGHRAQHGFVALPTKPTGLTGTAWATGEGTLGSLSNGRRTVVVGAAQLCHPDPGDQGSPRWEAASYSSAGMPGNDPNDPAACRTARRTGPDLAAPGQAAAAGYWSGAFKQLAGTSVAAAQVTRRLALALARQDGVPTRHDPLQPLRADPYAWIPAQVIDPNATIRSIGRGILNTDAGTGGKP